MWSAVVFILVMVAEALQKVLSLQQVDSSASEELMMRACELLRLCDDDAIRDANRAAARNACLSMLEVYVRGLTGAKRGEIGVSLARYVADDLEVLRIDERNAGSLRKMGITFSGRYVLGHHACLAGDDPRAVYDLKAFGPPAMKSPTGSGASYRSFFIVPIFVNIHGSPAPIGYISIDSKRPYEFYGNRANVLAVECESIIARLRKLM